MQIHKPDTLNFATQPVDWQGQLRQSFTITLGIDLNAPGGAVLPIEQAYAAAMQALGQGDCLDMGLPKKQAEWLLAGNACAPRGQTSSGLVVDIRVGAGKRRFLADSEKPVAEIPLTWAQTWGTEAENPQGLKAGKVKRAPLTDAALPFGAPACPGPRGVWPCRMGHMGTYDANWLKNRWPGVPDDFDWIFYNLAQPQQFLPGGLKGDEEIELAGLHPDHPRIVCRLPGKTPRLFLTRADGDGKESEVKIQADTLWLFPNQLAGLLFWHGMAPCADESATDIQIARLTLEPEEPAAAAAEAGAEAPPPPPPEPPPAAAPPPSEAPAAAVADSSGGVSGATIAGVAAGAAGVAGAAFAMKKHHDKKAEQQKAAEAQKKAEEQKKQETPKTPESAAAAQSGEKTPAQSRETPQSPAAPAAQETPPASANLQAELQQQLTESIPEINQGLAEAGLPPLTPEQIAETRQHLNNYAAQVQAIEAQANQPQPELDEVLRQAGVPEDRIRAVQDALDLEMPDPDQAASPQEWSAAVDGYVRRFSDLLQPSDEVRDTMRKTLLIQGPGGDKVLEEMAGGPPPSPVEQLVQAGLKPEQAAGLVSALEADIPEGKDGLMLYAKQIEQAAGFPEGSVSDHIKAYQEVMDKIMAEHPELAEAQKTAEAAEAGKTAESSAKADAGKTAAATEAAGTAAETTKTAATDAPAKPSGPPKDRAGVLALLAGGGSLAGLALAGMNLSGLDLSGQDMSGTDLTGADLRNAALDQAALGQGKLSGADLSGASLAGANLAGADLSGAKAESTVFRQANLSGADLTGITAPDADFTASNLAGADLGKGSFKGADFGEAQGPGLKAESADFTGAGLRFCSMPEAQFAGSRFGGADIHQSVMDRAVFRRAQLADARFCAGTSVAGADFAGADMSGTLWSQVRGAGAGFTGVTARGASFADCDLAACRWPGADLRESDFSRTGLAGAEMRGVNLFKASLREADLSRTNLAQANLYGADLCRAKIDPSTQLAGADHTNTILAAREAA